MIRLLASMLLVLLSAILPAAVAKPDYAVEPANCVSSECHQETLDYATLHGPVAAGTCNACHWVESVAEHTFKLAREKEELCTFCHEFSTGMLPVVHQPVMNGECLGCHNPHGGFDRRFVREDAVANTCGRCHEDVTRSKSFLHDPLKAGECTGCHRPHASRFPKLLDEVGTDLCTACHRNFIEGMESMSFVHDPARHECSVCHDPHGSVYPMGMNQTVSDLCLGCHDEIRLSADGPFRHPAVESERSCLSCHTPHGGDLASLLCDLPVNVCMDCHDDRLEKQGKESMTAMVRIADPTRFKHTPVRQGQCGGCHTIHGGDREHLLTGGYTTSFYERNPGEPQKLCFDCHDRRIVTEEDGDPWTNFRNGNINLHRIHVFGEGDLGRNCRACHGVHTSALPALLRDKVPYGNWEMELRFEQTETGATCGTGCHPELAYDRVNPVEWYAAPATDSAVAAASPRVPTANPEHPRYAMLATTDVEGSSVQVPTENKATVMVFLRPGNVQTPEILSIATAAADALAQAQVVVLFCGQGADGEARSLASENPGCWSIVADTGEEMARLMGVTLWPSTIVSRANGVVVGHLGGARPTLAREIEAYLDLATGRIDRDILAERLSDYGVLADSSAVRARWHLETGFRLLREGQPERAREVFADGLVIEPGSRELTIALVRATAAAGENSKALEILRKMPQDSAPDPERILLRAGLLADLGQWNQARSLVLDLVAQEDAPAEAHYLMGRVYQHEGAWENAAREFRLAFQGQRFHP